MAWEGGLRCAPPFGCAASWSAASGSSTAGSARHSGNMRTRRCSSWTNETRWASTSRRRRAERRVPRRRTPWKATPASGMCPITTRRRRVRWWSGWRRRQANGLLCHCQRAKATSCKFRLAMPCKQTGAPSP
uniref:Uncharacterized protein n=1 Tax=Ixodes ricinus TaxID=34613 RepID=A0A6B0UR84_IXORI